APGCAPCRLRGRDRRTGMTAFCCKSPRPAPTAGTPVLPQHLLVMPRRPSGAVGRVLGCYHAPEGRFPGAAMDYLAGRRLGSDGLGQEVGRGGMGAVFLGVHTVLGQTRAIKVLPPQMALDRDFVQRFRREAKLAAALDHPNIVPIYDIGEADGFHYIV